MLDHPINGVYEAFAWWAKRQPEALALVDDEGSLSYAELDQLTGAIAEHIPRDGSPVGIVCDHGRRQVAAMLAVLKNGNAYVPAEPDFPRERIRFMFDESHVSCVLTERCYEERFPDRKLVLLDDLGQPEPESASEACAQASSADLAVSPDAPAYVLYTSGSTGVPKGVVVTNRNLCHYARAFAHEFHPEPGDVMLQYSVCSFDIFVEEVFASLLNGAALAIPSSAVRSNLRETMEFAAAKGVTIISGFPYLVAEINDGELAFPSLRLLISGGDVLRARFADKLPSGVELYNTYGPSETTVCATYFRCTDALPLEDGSYPIGRAILGVTVDVRDDELRPLPPGEVGEICIRGDGVSNGYLDPSKNGAFVTLPDGERLYRSGDLGYELPSGDLAFLHRRDSQVMILGRRVELGEVSSVLDGCEGVKMGEVHAWQDSQGLPYLTAYVVPSEEGLDLGALKRAMSEKLASFMIPEFFVTMDALPLTENGKLDVGRLPVVLKEGSY